LDVATSVTPRRNRPSNNLAKDHGVGDVVHEELIEANYPCVRAAITLRNDHPAAPHVAPRYLASSAWTSRMKR
jgi:hypothetical protein